MAGGGGEEGALKTEIHKKKGVKEGLWVRITVEPHLVFSLTLKMNQMWVWEPKCIIHAGISI